jgi:hypothetical protein
MCLLPARARFSTPTHGFTYRGQRRERSVLDRKKRCIVLEFGELAGERLAVPDA